MTLEQIEQDFITSTPEAQKRFLKHNMKKLSDKKLLGRFYKLYAQHNLPKPIKQDDPYKVLNEPLLKGGDLDD